tara:strand:- start:332 stop:1105 length:774 start_codon:yes stop_codon:yes gene_type:complete
MNMEKGNISGWSGMSDEYQEKSFISLTDIHLAPLSLGDQEVGLIDNFLGKRFLELGCGAAQNSIVADRNGACAVAVDGSSRQLYHALKLRVESNSNVELVKADLENLDWLKSESFDYVISMFALEFVEDIERFIAQCFRALHADGTFILSTVHPLSAFDWDHEKSQLIVSDYFNPPLEIWKDSKSENNPPNFTLFRTIGEIFTTISNAGFVVEKLLEPVAEHRMDRAKIPYGGEYWEPFRDRLERIPFAIVIKARKP